MPALKRMFQGLAIFNASFWSFITIYLLTVCSLYATLCPVDNCKINLEPYVRNDGKSPFEEWINGLKDIKTRNIIRARLNRIRLGNFGNCKPLHEGVFELKIDLGPGFRVYYGRQGKDIVILLCGGTKRSQIKDIKIAKEFWEDYKRRIKT